MFGCITISIGLDSELPRCPNSSGQRDRIHGIWHLHQGLSSVIRCYDSLTAVACSCAGAAADSQHCVVCISSAATTVCMVHAGLVTSDSAVAHNVRSTAACGQDSRTYSKANSVQGRASSWGHGSCLCREAVHDGPYPVFGSSCPGRTPADSQAHRELEYRVIHVRHQIHKVNDE